MSRIKAKKYFSYREELRGVSRGKNAKDVDWQKIAGAIEIEVTEKPEAIKISVNEVLKSQRVRKPEKHIILKSQLEAEKHGKFDFFF